MKRAAIFIILSAACATTTPPHRKAAEVLRGTHTILIEDRYAKEMFEPIGRALPDVRLVSDAAKADIVITFDASNPMNAPASYQSVPKSEVVVGDHVEQSPQTVQVRIDQPTSSPPKTIVVRAVNRANGKSVVLWHGFADSMRFAPAFIDAWLDANS